MIRPLRLAIAIAACSLLGIGSRAAAEEQPSTGRSSSSADSPAADSSAPADPAADASAPADPAARRLEHQISVFEKVVDQTLIDSEHALVSGSPNCRGLRLAGYGVLFVVELSPILGNDDILHFRFKDDGSYEVEYDGEKAKDKDRKRIEGRTRSRGRRDDAEDGDSSDPDIEYVDPSDSESAADSTDHLPPAFRNLVKNWGPNSQARLEDPERTEVLRLVREELLETLRDYGHTLTGLGPDERIAIAIFPSDLDWRGGPGTRQILQVKRRDVDAFNAGQITDEVFHSRVEVLTQ
jgi:hypothetical protein